jgi:hypothetical protein
LCEKIIEMRKAFKEWDEISALCTVKIIIRRACNEKDD